MRLSPGGHPPTRCSLSRAVRTPGARRLERVAGPALLIAHPELNSLPAALEILGARQLGRRPRLPARRPRDGFDTLTVSRTPRRAAPPARLAWAASARRPTGSSPARRTRHGGRAGDPPCRCADRRGARGGAADPAEPLDRADFLAAASAVGEPSPEDSARRPRRAALREVAAGHALDACAVRCFDLVSAARTSGCWRFSWLLDHGVVAGCEGDVPATITMMWIGAMTGGPTFLATRRTWTSARTRLARALHDRAADGVAYSLRSHFESSLGVGIAASIEPGDATVAPHRRCRPAPLCVSDAARRRRRRPAPLPHAGARPPVGRRGRS